MAGRTERKRDLATSTVKALGSLADMWEAVDKRADMPPAVKSFLAGKFKEFKDAQVTGLLDNNKHGFVNAEDWAKVQAKKPGGDTAGDMPRDGWQGRGLGLAAATLSRLHGGDASRGHASAISR